MVNKHDARRKRQKATTGVARCRAKSGPFTFGKVK